MSKQTWAKSIAWELRPYIASLLKSKRPLKTDWRLDKSQRPPPRPFEQSSHILNELRNERAKKVIDNTKNLRRPYRILSLDGGGVRGALTMTILNRIIKHNPKFLDQVDLICGTSAGGLLALMLAAGYSADEVTRLYHWSVPHIFGFEPLRVINPFVSKYSDKTKEEFMRMYLGNRTMMDLEKPCCVIAFRLDGKKSATHSFFNVDGWRPAVFTNMPRAGGLVEPDIGLMAWEAAMRTSAAPTYFPVFQGYVDGGIVANNPSVVAVTKVMAHFPNVSLNNVCVLSLGAGYFPRHDKVFENESNSITVNGEKVISRADWGYRQWLPFLVDMLLDGDAITIDLIMHYLLGRQHLYHRLDPRLPKNIALDDALSLDDLTAFGNSIDITETLKFVDTNFKNMTTAEDLMVTNELDNSHGYHDAWQSYVLWNKEDEAPLKIDESKIVNW